MASSTRRLQNEYRQLQRISGGMVVTPQKDNLRQLEVKMPGPADSPYQGYQLSLRVEIPDSYPLQPPVVYCGQGIIHPNVDRGGRVCLNILDEDWKPNQSIETVLVSLSALLCEPNPDSPYNGQLAHLWVEDREEYSRQVTECCRQHLLPL